MTEPGPLILVLGDCSRPLADAHATFEARRSGVEPDHYIGLGWAMPDPYAPDGLWLHTYATTRPSGLQAAYNALESR